MVSRAIDTQLSWQRNNQDNIFGVKTLPAEKRTPYNATDHVQEREDDPEKDKVFLSSSLHGSSRHLRALANEALCVVSELGPPTLFITATCNPRWREIEEQLLEGQTAFDRPDVVNMVSIDVIQRSSSLTTNTSAHVSYFVPPSLQVFHDKLQHLLSNLRNENYFPGHKVVYIMHVIEYQHRGMPHAHIVVKLSDMPGTSYIRDNYNYV
jgi:hypothetical protein